MTPTPISSGRSKERARLIACGYGYVDEARGVQRLTWKGAFVTTLKMIWPVRQIRKLWRRWKGARMLRELNLR
jgi:hypothetical protein